MYWLDTVYIPNLATVKRLQHTGTKRNQTNCLLLLLNLANENSQNQQKTKKKVFPTNFFKYKNQQQCSSEWLALGLFCYNQG